jgi:hypothetical protein
LPTDAHGCSQIVFCLRQRFLSTDAHGCSQIVFAFCKYINQGACV